MKMSHFIFVIALIAMSVHVCVALVMIIDAEGVVATDVQLKRLSCGSQRRSVRSSRLSGLYSLSDEDLGTLEDDSGELLNE